MKPIVLSLVAALTLSAGSASAASYQMTDGTIVDPIQNTYGGDSAYSGNNLEPGADLQLANLRDADLTEANLRYADLSYADLSGADLLYADLSNARLFGADFRTSSFPPATTWTGAKFSINAVGNDGNPIPDTVFPSGFNPYKLQIGMIAVPEPTTALLVGIGLIGLGVRRRS